MASNPGMSPRALQVQQLEAKREELLKLLVTNPPPAPPAAAAARPLLVDVVPMTPEGNAGVAASVVPINCPSTHDTAQHVKLEDIEDKIPAPKSSDTAVRLEQSEAEKDEMRVAMEEMRRALAAKSALKQSDNAVRLEQSEAEKDAAMEEMRRALAAKSALKQSDTAVRLEQSEAEKDEMRVAMEEMRRALAAGAIVATGESVNTIKDEEKYAEVASFRGTAPLCKLREFLPPILRHFDPDLQPVVVVYANDWAISAALMQEHDGIHYPVTFVSLDEAHC